MTYVNNELEMEQPHTKTEPNTQTLQNNVPLSQSYLWKYQRDFFAKEGINAWDKKVPFYITSNPYIANSYANIVIRFIQDCIRNKSYDKSKPFYILELGTGTGKFSFYMLRRLVELQNEFKLNDVSFVYVMSDFTKNNMKFWERHPAFKSYIKNDMLDFLTCLIIRIP